MPRKTLSPAQPMRQCFKGFNEAAARCHGKRKPAMMGISAAQIASMRPRPDATENTRNRTPADAGVWLQ